MTTNKTEETKTIVIPFGAAPKSETFGDFHDGNVVSFSDGRLVMATLEGREYSFSVATDAYVCRDGVICLVEELALGSKIRLITKADNINVATKIEALDQQVDFADLD